MDALKIISEGSIKAEKPQFNVGDTVRVDVRIKEGDRERIQAFEGTVIAKKHGGVAETLTPSVPRWKSTALRWKASATARPSAP